MVHTAAMSRWRTLVLTTLALAAVAGNVQLRQAALRETSIDAATFAAIRITGGALRAEPLTPRAIPVSIALPGGLALVVPRQR